MESSNVDEPGPVARSRHFATTHWSVVLRAGQDSGPAGTAALEQLCRAYWLPLYAFVRRSGHGPEDAADLTQEFFARLLGRNWLGQVQPAKGRFRSYLLGAMKHFLANEWHRTNSQRRGGGAVTISISIEDGEQRMGNELAHADTPERAYERRWADALLDQVMIRLATEYANHPLGWPVLEMFVVEPRPGLSLIETAAARGVTESALRAVVHRLRSRYQEIVRDEVANTVATPGEIEDELRHLIELVQA